MAVSSSIVAEATVSLYVATNLVSLEMMKAATTEDEILQKLITTIENGMTGIQELPQEIRPFHRYGPQFYTVDGVVMVGSKIVIPTMLRKQV